MAFFDIDRLNSIRKRFIFMKSSQIRAAFTTVIRIKLLTINIQQKQQKNLKRHNIVSFRFHVAFFNLDYKKVFLQLEEKLI